MPISLPHKSLRITLILGLQTVLITGLSYYLGVKFTTLFHDPAAQIGGLWSALSGLIVLQSTIRETLKSSLLRLIGTFIGALVCAIYLWLFGFSIIGMALCAGLAVSICDLLGIFEYARLAAVTVVIIAVISVRTPELSPFLNSFLRFCEAVIGVGICIACVYGLRPFVRPRQ